MKKAIYANTVTEEEKNRTEFLALVEDLASSYHKAGLDGNVLEAFPELTADTSAEDELQMINSSIEHISKELGYGILSADVVELVIKVSRYAIIDYRKGLAERARTEFEKRHSQLSTD